MIIKKSKLYKEKKIYDIKTKIKILKYLTNNDNALYEGAEKCLENDPDSQLCIYQFICPKKVINKERVLIGLLIDGSYVILDDFKNIKIAYSIGIDCSIHLLKLWQIKELMYICMIIRLKNYHTKNQKFHWKKIGIGSNDNRNNNILTLTDIIKEKGHLNEKNMILKIEAKVQNGKPLMIFLKIF